MEFNKTAWNGAPNVPVQSQVLSKNWRTQLTEKDAGATLHKRHEQVTLDTDIRHGIDYPEGSGLFKNRHNERV